MERYKGSLAKDPWFFFLGASEEKVGAYLLHHFKVITNELERPVSLMRITKEKRTDVYVMSFFIFWRMWRNLC